MTLKREPLTPADLKIADSLRRVYDDLASAGCLDTMGVGTMPFGAFCRETHADLNESAATRFVAFRLMADNIEEVVRWDMDCCRAN